MNFQQFLNEAYLAEASPTRERTARESFRKKALDMLDKDGDDDTKERRMASNV